MYTTKHPDHIIKEWSQRDKDIIINKSGIYAVYVKNICLYVGVGQCLLSRVSRFYSSTRNMRNILLCMIISYCKDNNIKLEVKIYFHEADHLKNLEYEYIRILRARLNNKNRPYQGKRKPR